VCTRRVRGRMLALTVATLLAGVVIPAAAEPGGTSSFDYLYINANEGGSSGGHVAVRFGPHIYHFQNREGLLVLDRERAQEFLFSYALLNNRTIHVSQISIEDEVETRLADRFLRRYRVQEAQLAVRDALRQDRRLLESAEAPNVLVRGYGYFARRIAPVAEGSAVLLALREKIVARRGADFLDSRRRTLLKTLDAMGEEDPAGWPVSLPDSAYDRPAFAQPWSSRLVDLAAGLAALDVLDGAPGLEPATVNAPQSDEFLLDADERAALTHFAIRLEDQLVDLVGSHREDWGQPLLIGMARLASLDTSLASGRFVFLDSFPEQHGSIDARTLRSRREIVPLMLRETRRQLVAISPGWTMRENSPGSGSRSDSSAITS